MKLVVLAGGRGTRMGALTKDLPKPMIRLAGKPILEHQIELAKRYGFTDIHILTGHLGDVIEEYFGGGERWGVEIRYAREREPLGTAGAVREIADRLDEDFLVFYGDVMMDVDLASLVRFHRDRQPVATIVMHPNDHPYDSDLVEIDADSRVVAFHSKPHPPGADLRNLVSAALYVLLPSVLGHVPKGAYSDFGRDVLPRLLASGEAIYGYNTREYIKDIGTAERLAEVENDVHSGRVSRFNLAHKVGAVFLDRDGVLNREVEPLRTADELELLPGVSRAIRQLNKSDRLAVVVTNQPLIAKGFASERALYEIHGRLETSLSADGAYLDRIYHCPHHPESGFPGERPEYKIDCDCRKPRTGMIARATSDLNIDLADSFIVGDRTVDVLTGINAGVGTILVRTGRAGDDGQYWCEPDFVCEDLENAVRFVTERYGVLIRHASELLPRDIMGRRSRAMVLVGGLSRSGKSTLASALSIVMERRGTPARRLRLDHWLLGVDQRAPGMTVRDRYRYDDIVRAIDRLLKGEQLEFSRYVATRRQASAQKGTLSLNEGELLIVDGVVALDIPVIRDAAVLRLYAETSEETRKARFRVFYRHKGLSEQAIEDLYLERQGDETPIVVASGRHSDRVVDLETLT